MVTSIDKQDDNGNPLVSVVVPIFNVEKYLRRCLESIVGQSYANIEIICVDDASEDDSAAIANQIAERDKRVHIVKHQNNKGLGAARDTGVDIATGSYIIFVDSDDYIGKEYVQLFVDAISDADIAIGGYTRQEGDTLTQQRLIQTYEQAWTYVSACGKMFRTDFLKRNNLFFRNIRYYEDVLFNYRCMLCHPRIAFVDNLGYYYVLNPSSITRSGNQELKFLTYVDSHNKIGEEYSNFELNEKDHSMLEYGFCQALTIGMLVNIRHIGPKKARRLYEERKACLSRFFPDYLNNKNIGFSKLSCEYANIRVVLTLYTFAERFHFDWPFVWLLSH